MFNFAPSENLSNIAIRKLPKINDSLNSDTYLSLMKTLCLLLILLYS